MVADPTAPIASQRGTDYYNAVAADVRSQIAEDLKAWPDQQRARVGWSKAMVETAKAMVLEFMPVIEGRAGAGGRRV